MVLNRVSRMVEFHCYWYRLLHFWYCDIPVPYFHFINDIIMFGLITVYIVYFNGGDFEGWRSCTVWEKPRTEFGAGLLSGSQSLSTVSHCFRPRHLAASIEMTLGAFVMHKVLWKSDNSVGQNDRRIETPLWIKRQSISCCILERDYEPVPSRIS